MFCASAKLRRGSCVRDDGRIGIANCGTEGIVIGGMWPPVTAVTDGSVGRDAGPDKVDMAIFFEGCSSASPSQLRFRRSPELFEFTAGDKLGCPKIGADADGYFRWCGGPYDVRTGGEGSLGARTGGSVADVGVVGVRTGEGCIVGVVGCVSLSRGSRAALAK